MMAGLSPVGSTSRETGTLTVGHIKSGSRMNSWPASWIGSRRPDLICVLNESEYRGLSNWDEFKEEKDCNITVIGIPAHPIWKTEKGRNVFNVELEMRMSM